MKIAISGSHGTGKSSYVYKKAQEEKIENPTKRISIVSEVARDCPFPINKTATEQSQL